MTASNHVDQPSAFFKRLARAFHETLLARDRRADYIGVLCAQAFDSFEGNVAVFSNDAPALACKGECDACCALRVVATAPEIFLLARFVTVNMAALAARQINLPERIAAVAMATRGLSEQERLTLRRCCPFIENGLCVAYRVRPLACRGHASYDRAACEAAVSGQAVETAISTTHLVMRSLVQNALMSSLRDAELSFGLYELNQALQIALSHSEAQAEWTAGGDPLRAALIAEFDMSEAASLFDSIRAEP